MPGAVEAPSPPTRPRDRSRAARRAGRARKAERERRIVGLLNRGRSMAEMAESEGVSLNRMRKVVRAIIEKRTPQPPAEYLALQVGRLNEAMLLSFNAMHDDDSGANFKAIDSVVKIVREMDRYHGFVPAGGRAQSRRLRAPASGDLPLALAPAGSRVANGAASG